MNKKKPSADDWQLVVRRDNTDEYYTTLEPLGIHIPDSLSEEDANTLAAAKDLLVACLRFAAHHVCQCDCSVDKETGESPPEANVKNSFGEPVWANEVCDYCIARAALAKAKGQTA